MKRKEEAKHVQSDHQTPSILNPVAISRESPCFLPPILTENAHICPEKISKAEENPHDMKKEEKRPQKAKVKAKDLHIMTCSRVRRETKIKRFEIPSQTYPRPNAEAK